MIDLDHLEKYVGDDIALRDEILTIFCEQAEMLGGNLSVSAADDSWRDIAHALKGASLGVGAWALGKFCEEAESLIGEIPEKTERREMILVSIRKSITEALGDVRRLCAAAA